MRALGGNTNVAQVTTVKLPPSVRLDFRNEAGSDWVAATSGSRSAAVDNTSV